jgi:hypothetical protein
MIDEKMGFVDGLGDDPNIQERTRALLAICLNIIPVRVFQRRRADRSLQGLVLITLVYAAIWFYYYGSKLLG